MTTLRNLWDRLTTRTNDGCCTCGGPHADYSYYGAMEGSDPSRPDWEQCVDCHNEDGDHAEWMRSLRHEAKGAAA